MVVAWCDEESPDFRWNNILGRRASSEHTWAVGDDPNGDDRCSESKGEDIKLRSSALRFRATSERLGLCGLLDLQDEGYIQYLNVSRVRSHVYRERYANLGPTPNRGLRVPTHA